MIRFKKRSAQAFLIGCIMSFFWLLPVFGPPANNAFEGQLTPLRVIRLVAPFLVWLLVTPREINAFLYSLTSKIPRGILPISALGILLVTLVFVIVPFLSASTDGSLPFFISGVMPVVAGGMILIGFVLLAEKDFRNIALGLGFMTLCFLLVGMVSTGFASTIYFGRVRILMGFDHPLYSATAVLGSMIYVSMVSKSYFFRCSPPARALLLLGFLGASCILLYITQDRDILSTSLLAIVCSLIARRFSTSARIGVTSFFIFGQILLYMIVLFVPDDSAFWTPLNTLTSMRLQNYRALLLNLIGQGNIGFLSNASGQHPLSNAPVAQAVSNYVGFSVIDSVFLSFLINYGLVGLVCLVGMFLILAWRLSQSRETAIAFGALCALTIVFTLDGVGVTTSNLVIFVIFAYVIRVSLRPSASRQIV